MQTGDVDCQTKSACGVTTLRNQFFVVLSTLGNDGDDAKCYAPKPMTYLVFSAL